MWQKIKNIYHLFQAIAANIMYGFPSRGMTLIGVTGTDGKTTTANILYHILKEAGHKVAVVSTVSAIIDGKASDVGFHVTTPSSFAVQKYLKKAKKQGTKYFVLETTSHGLDQNRVWGINYRVGIVTNISHEHLDYHKTYENYVAAKAKLLKASQTAVVNRDDRSYKFLKKYIRHKKVITYGMKRDSLVNPHVFPFKTKLIGKFNQYNSLAAIAALSELGIREEVIRKGLVSFKPPIGRQEIVYDKDFKVVIDFAHTPNSFVGILPEIKKETRNRLIHVFGSAGLRDATKRPEMGKVAASYDDVIVLTSEDPRNEPIEKIMDDIAEGVKDSKFDMLHPDQVKESNFKLAKGRRYIVRIPDRKEAIHFAIMLAQKGDTVIATGKSHEKSMNYGKGEEPWSEFDATKEALRERKLVS